MHDDFRMPVCPKCRHEMAFVTALPHPKSTSMLRTTFLCQPCSRTWSYSLPPEMAERYGPETKSDLPKDAIVNPA